MPSTAPSAASLSLADINREAYIFAGAGATVAWQLAMPGVGLGVARHSTTLQRPLARLQATMGYIYAVTLGTDADRAAMARHVNHAHRPVNGPGYNAFDRDLQLWVAATLYRGALEVHTLFVGAIAPHNREAIYRQAWTFGRTLQVRDSQWPANVDAFEAWWSEQLAHLHVSQEVRHYFQQVMAGGNTPWYLKPALPVQRFITRGLMSPQLRDLFQQPWTTTDARRWQRFVRWAPRLYACVPRTLRQWPARHYLAQVRRHTSAARSPR